MSCKFSRTNLSAAFIYADENYFLPSMANFQSIQQVKVKLR